jgi:D-alanyl-D-alanine carboxypeptidase (penicillin-binding protein 5/6)
LAAFPSTQGPFSVKHPILRLSLILVCSHLTCAFAAPIPAGPSGAMIPAPPQLTAKAWVLMDAASGNVIASEDPDERLPPASLTKLMTVYVATRQMQAGGLKPDDLVTISENAWNTGGSRMFLVPGSQVSVHDLLKGVVIDSGNDAAVALSEHIAGSEDSFAGLMNSTAQKLGLSNTHFMNPTGLPADGHYSSADDMARLARAIINDETAYYELYAHKHFTWNGIKQPNRNLLLWRDNTVDGLKTGHTEAAGYCMVTSAVRDGRRLITATFGSTSIANRAADAEKLLTYGYRFYDTQTYQKAGQTLSTPMVWKADSRVLQVGLLDDVSLTLPKNPHRKTETRLHIDKPLVAPIAVGDVVGTYALYEGDRKLAERPLIALQATEPGSLLSRAWDSLRLFVGNLFGEWSEAA